MTSSKHGWAVFILVCKPTWTSFLAWAFGGLTGLEQNELSARKFGRGLDEIPGEAFQPLRSQIVHPAHGTLDRERWGGVWV